MKYFIAIALLAAVASAAVKPTPISGEAAEIQEIIAAIQSPSTDPATAAALEDMLLDILGVKPEPVQVGPAIINPVEGISVGPAIIPFPIPDGGAVAEEPIVPGPAIVAPAPAPSSAVSPLVQIIVNVHQAAAEASPVAVGPAVDSAPVNPILRPEPIGRPEPVGEIPAEPVQVVEVAPEPVQVVEVAPVVVEPVQIGVPIIPEAAVVLPEELN